MSRRRIRNRVVFAVALALAICLVYFVALFYHVYTTPREDVIRDYRLSRPAPYADSPYWSREFVLEYDKLHFALTPGGWWAAQEYHGIWYNFNAGGERLVIGTPTHYTHTIWLYGNSGLQDPYVPDAYTAASQLQAFLPAYRIVNRGSGAQLVSGELAWLKASPPAPGDMVIYVDGMMDILGKTSAARYWQQVYGAQEYTRSRGAMFLHFLQAYADPDYMDAYGKPFVDVPSGDFLDGPHINERGDAIVAAALYRALTTF